MSGPPRIVDVVVVGAGFAGLAAARELNRQGHDVVVFEGRDRVGGRSFTGSVAGLPADLGGTFVGPTQDAVLALAAELEVPTTPTHHEGKNLIHWRGWTHAYHGTIPKLSLTGLLDIGRLRWQFDRIARSIPLAAPWEARRAAELDGLSLGGWLRSVRATASSHALLAMVARVTWGCEPDEVSMLHAARYAHAAGGLDRLLDVEDGAQQDRFPGGTQQIAAAAAAELGARVVLGAPVRRIERHGAGVTVRTDLGDTEAGFVIVAIPPAHRAADRVRPAAARRVRAAGPALAAGPAQQGLRGLFHPVLAGRRLLRAGAVGRGPGFHHLRRQPAPGRPGHPDGFRGRTRLRLAARRPAPPRRIALFRNAFRRRRAQAPRLCRSPLGR